jgi:hypothetical protein
VPLVAETVGNLDAALRSVYDPRAFVALLLVYRNFRNLLFFTMFSFKSTTRCCYCSEATLVVMLNIWLLDVAREMGALRMKFELVEV